MGWYILRVEPGREELAEHLVKQRGYQTWLPIKTRWRRKNKFCKAKVERRTALMLGYMFVEVDDRLCDWFSLLTTNRVNGVVGDERGPYRLRDHVVPELQKRFGNVIPAPKAERWMRTYREFSVGDDVIVIGGPFAGTGELFTVHKIRGHSASILMHLFGALTEVKVPLENLLAAE